MRVAPVQKNCNLRVIPGGLGSAVRWEFTLPRPCCGSEAACYHGPVVGPLSYQGSVVGPGQQADPGGGLGQAWAPGGWPGRVLVCDPPQPPPPKF